MGREAGSCFGRARWHGLPPLTSSKAHIRITYSRQTNRGQFAFHLDTKSRLAMPEPCWYLNGSCRLALALAGPMVALVSTLNGKLSSSVVLFRELEDMIKELWDGTGAGLSLRRRIGKDNYKSGNA